jgi:hypothetical protein
MGPLEDIVFKSSRAHSACSDEIRNEIFGMKERAPYRTASIEMADSENGRDTVLLNVWMHNAEANPPGCGATESRSG